MDIISLFCEVDDFCIEYNQQNPKRLCYGSIVRNRKKKLTTSEIITILIHFHQSGYRNFKHYYKNYVCIYLGDLFHDLVSYNRFVELMQSVMHELCSFLVSRFDDCTGISYIDSTTIKVCNNKRISRNKVFKNVASRGKSSMGWFYGFKLHLIVNENGGLLAVKITPGNINDRVPVPQMIKSIFGKLFGDKGYVSQKLFENLYEKGLKLITNVKKGMKNKLMELGEKILLRKRSVIETINDQLKNISQIEHTRHRSCVNFMVNLICGLLAYTFQEKRPCINFSKPTRELTLLA